MDKDMCHPFRLPFSGGASQGSHPEPFLRLYIVFIIVMCDVLGLMLLGSVTSRQTRSNLTLMPTLARFTQFSLCWYLRSDSPHSGEGRVCYRKFPDSLIWTHLSRSTHTQSFMPFWLFGFDESSNRLLLQSEPYTPLLHWCGCTRVLFGWPRHWCTCCRAYPLCVSNVYIEPAMIRVHLGRRQTAVWCDLTVSCEQ